MIYNFDAQYKAFLREIIGVKMYDRVEREYDTEECKERYMKRIQESEVSEHARLRDECAAVMEAMSKEKETVIDELFEDGLRQYFKKDGMPPWIVEEMFRKPD